MTSVEVTYDVYLEWRNLSQEHADMVDTRVEAFRASTFVELEAASSAGVEGSQELVPETDHLGLHSRFDESGLQLSFVRRMEPACGEQDVAILTGIVLGATPQTSRHRGANGIPEGVSSQESAESEQKCGGIECTRYASEGGEEPPSNGAILGMVPCASPARGAVGSTDPTRSAWMGRTSGATSWSFRDGVGETGSSSLTQTTLSVGHKARTVGGHTGAATSPFWVEQPLKRTTCWSNPFYMGSSERTVKPLPEQSVAYGFLQSAQVEQELLAPRAST